MSQSEERCTWDDVLDQQANFVTSLEMLHQIVTAVKKAQHPRADEWIRRTRLLVTQRKMIREDFPARGTEVGEKEFQDYYNAFTGIGFLLLNISDLMTEIQNALATAEVSENAHTH